MSGSASFSCVICRAAHLEVLPGLTGQQALQHEREHVGPQGSTAHAELCNDGQWRVLREGNGNRWTEREKYNPQPPASADWTDQNGEPVEAPMPDPEGGLGLKLEDFLASVIGTEALGEDPGACDAGACDCDPIDDDGGLPHKTLPEGERITDEAWRLVMGDRQSSYNHPARDFEATGRMWAAILTNWLDLDEPMPDVHPRIVALMIAMVKVSRESHKHKHDNLVDLIGYALCADRVTRDY